MLHRQHSQTVGDLSSFDFHTLRHGLGFPVALTDRSRFRSESYQLREASSSAGSRSLPRATHNLEVVEGDAFLTHRHLSHTVFDPTDPLPGSLRSTSTCSGTSSGAVQVALQLQF